ncbi:Dedicator of cytokinesis protein 1 [Pleurostoma richardsiae]|uniref:Dedicator of cytokinesis protein 1 n=1 Tax=Pleurostoma richardsiae TaxID=41990 RepID=A0AA38RCD6_9PEZI|nr:Dedicator of cytokinesis protein 1 [Pleurostoma richardsiae]
MPWQPLPRIAFAVATYPFTPQSPEDLPLEIGDELYIIEETPDGSWLRGYLVAPPSLLAGLTSVKGQTLEARVYNGIFPRSCVEVREMLGESDDTDDNEEVSEDGEAGGDDAAMAGIQRVGSDSAKSGLTGEARRRRKRREKGKGTEGNNPAEGRGMKWSKELPNGTQGRLSIPVKRDPDTPRPQAPVPMLKIGDETPTSASEPLIDEIASCLREWHSTNLHELLLSRQYAKLDKLSQLITTLYFSRQQFLHNVLTGWEYRNLREKTVWDLVKVNKLCGGEVIVRDPKERGRVLTGDDSVVEITRLQSVMTLLDEPPQAAVESSALHHLLVDVKGFAGASIEATTLVLYLATKPAGGLVTQLSESYIIQIPAGGMMGHLGKNAQAHMRTLFADLSPSDIGSIPSAETELFLVVKVRTARQITAGKPSSRSGVGSQRDTYAKDLNKPPLSSGNKSMRRSLMWAQKSTRSAFSRGSPMAKLDEQPEERPMTGPDSESRDGPPPSTAGSRVPRMSIDGTVNMVADRTIGVGVLKLNAMMKQDDEVEHVLGVWSPSARFVAEKQDGGEDWDPLVRELMESKSGQYEKSRSAERLQVHLKPFDAPDADALIKATPTLLAGICKTNKMGFSGAPTKPRSDIYVTLDEAVLTRQTLLSRYGGSATAIPTTVHGSNLQVTLEVRRPSGERIDNCIYPSSNSDGLSTWKSAATERGEPWRQTFRLLLSAQDVFTSHVVVFLADLPNPPFAIAYMPLWDQRAFVSDGPHALLLYRIDEHTATAQPTAGTVKGGYLSLPWSARGKGEHSADVTGPLATLRLDTYLCSTRFSQDRVVLSLLKWKELPKEEVPDLLKQLIFVAEIEVVKLLSDVLDSLFGILVEYSGNDEYEDLVFTALVRVLDIVHDRRFNLAPLVDHYAESRFNYPFATPCLVRSFTRLLEKPTEPETARKLRATFKVVRHILKFITHARGQQKAKEAGIGITGSTPGFTRHLRSIFKALDSLMRSTAPVLVGSQTLAVQHFHTWLPELAGLLTTEEILHIAIDFMDSCSSVKGKLVLYKLVLIINYAKLDIFAHPEQRSALSANTVRWIAPHWGLTEEVTEQWREQVRLCCSVLASQVDHLGPEIPDYIPKILESYLTLQALPQKSRHRLSLLFPTAYPFPSKPTGEEVTFDEALVELSAVLSALSNSPSGMQLELALDDLGVVLDNTLRVHMSILQGEAFPANWLSVHIFHHKSTMRTLQYLSTILLESFLPDPDDAESFNTELWKMFFSTMLKLVGSPSLALETFPEQKRRAVWKIAGDVREHGAELLRRTWEAIGWETSPDERQSYGLTKMGGYQVQYVPTLVGPIVELCLSVHEGLRRMAVEVLQTMIVSEWTLSEDLSVIQTEVIDCLDIYFKSKPLTESILQKLFVGELLDRFQPLAQEPDDPFYLAIRELMATVDEFLDLLVAVHSDDVSGEASHLINRLRLMEFLRNMQKEEIFVRYVHQLANLQVEARNHAEAGLALRLHADLYDWDPIRTTPALIDPEYSAQSHFERKERIYFDMIKHFEDGEAWSSALDAYKELQTQYETNIFDFAKLARAERAIATIYETISKTDRIVPKYYKVAFKGLGFPTSIRDKEYIYEGSSPAERASAFTDRMQEQHPSAQIVTGSEAATVDYDVEGQFLIVSAVSVHRDLSHHVFQRARVPGVIRDYLLSAHPQMFSVSSKRVTTGPVAEHRAEKVVYTTAEAFPTILRRSEIVNAHEVVLSAKETALERIVRKTQEMTAVERKILDGEAGDDVARLLVDAVTISVNPASESGVVSYRQLVPGRHQVTATAAEGEDEVDPDEEEEEVQLDPQENAIRMALVDHAIMIKRCLGMFARSANPILSRSYEDLQKYFEITFAPEIATFAPPQPARDAMPTTPSPSWPRTPPSLAPATPQHHQHQKSTASTATTTANGTGGVEVSTVRPVSLRQGRGARLSFLGGRKKEQVPPLPTQPSQQANGDGGEGEETASKSSRENLNRRSFFRSQSSDTGNSQNQGQQHNQQQRPATGGTTATNGAEAMAGLGIAGGNGNYEWGTVTDRNHHHHGTPGTTVRASSDLSTGYADSSREREKGGAAAVSVLETMTPGDGGMAKRGSVRKRLSMLKLGKKTSKGSGLMGSVVDEE